MGNFHNKFWEAEAPECRVTQAHLFGHRGLFIIRFLSLLLMAFIYYWCIFPLELVEYYYLTTWGATAVFLHFIFIMPCYLMYPHETPVASSNPIAYWKFVHVLFEFAFCMEVLIVPFYWAVLFPEEKPGMSQTVFQQNVCLHAITGLLIFIDGMGNRIYFMKNHGYLCLFLALSYSGLNYYVTESTGIAPYPVISWQWSDVSFWAYLILAMGIFMIGFLIGYLMSEKKRKTTDNMRMGLMIKVREDNLV